MDPQTPGLTNSSLPAKLISFDGNNRVTVIEDKEHSIYVRPSSIPAAKKVDGKVAP